MERKKIAVIGMSLKTSKVDNYAEFWKALKNGEDLIRSFPKSRIDEIKDIVNYDNSKNFVKGGYIDNVTYFEPEFFSISVEESKHIDPQQRILLELIEEAFEDAGVDLDRLEDRNIGVYIGNAVNQYKNLFHEGNSLEFVNGLDGVNAARAAYTFDLQGPVFNLDTACSSTLVALNLAAEAIKSGQINEAVVGAVQLSLFPEEVVGDLTDSVMSEESKTKAFNRNSDGFVQGEGGVVLILKDYDKAIEDGDYIHAVIRGSAVNNNGRRSNGIAAPSGSAQAEVIKKAIKDADIEPESISYIETHGTATKIGDPIEINAIKLAMEDYNVPYQSIGVGSVKTNIGHTGCVSGLFNLVKVILMMQNKEIVPSLHFTEPNYFIGFERSPVYLCTENSYWNEEIRRAGVSALGLTGTNVHVIVEEMDKVKNNIDTVELIEFSARTENSLINYLIKMKNYLKNEKDNISLKDVAYTLNYGRRKMKYKFITVADSIEELVENIDKFIKEKNYILIQENREKVKSAFILPGLSEWSSYKINSMELETIIPEEYGFIKNSSLADIKKEYLINVIYYVRKLQSYSIDMNAVVGVGEGSIVADYFTRAISLEDLIIKISSYPGSKGNSSDVARWSTLINKISGAGYELLISIGFSEELKKVIKLAAVMEEFNNMKLISSRRELLEVIMELMKSGHLINGTKINYKNCSKIPLPTYAFERRSLFLNGNPSFLNALTGTNTNIGATSESKEYTENTIDTLDTMLREVVKNSDFDMDGYIYDIGANSLEIMQFVSKIRKQYLIDIPVKIFYEGYKIRDLYTKIESLIEKSEAKEIYNVEKVKGNKCKASKAQNRMYVMNKMFKDSVAYNSPILVRIGGKLDKKNIRKIFKELLDRHEVLRTTYELNDGILYQKINDDISLDITFTDMSKYESVQEFADEFIKPFDLTKAPMMRFIIGEEKDSNVLMVDAHHICTDGFSSAILVEEFAKLYNGVTLEPVEYQYKDFSVWQNKFFESDLFKDQEKYWLKKFENLGEPLDMPVDYERSDLVQVEGNVERFEVKGEIFNKINKAIKTLDVSEYMFYLSALSILLSKYTNQSENVIGTPISGRKYEDFNKTLGLFVNTLALRNFPEGQKTFKEFLDEVKMTVLESYENQDYPFEMLVEKVVKDRSVKRNPIFDVLFAMQNISNSEEDKIDADISTIDIDQGVARFDIDIHAYPEDDAMKFKIEYCSNLYKKETIKIFIKRFIKLMEIITSDFNIKLQDIDIELDLDKELLANINNTMSEPEEWISITERFKSIANRYPNKTVFIDQGKGIKYQEAENEVNRISAFLKEKINIKSSDKVGIYMEDGKDFVISALGVMNIGAAYLPLDANYPKDRLESIIEDSGIKMIISKKKYIKTLNDLIWECDSLDSYLCIDSDDIENEIEEEKNIMMDEKLWNYVAEDAENNIEGGGWTNSFTGESFSKEEMLEYSDNVYKKVSPYINKNAKVLEIGCASGITMFRLAKEAKYYVGTDLSSAILEYDQRKIEEEGIENIKLYRLFAHEVDKIDEKFDCIVINSVIHCFHGHNYLRKVLNKCIGMLEDNGVIFIGDVMDLETRETFINELMKFRDEHIELRNSVSIDNIETKLFLSRKFFYNLGESNEDIEEVKCLDKIYTIENELTKYRYDVVLKVNKNKKSPISAKRYAYDLNDLEKFSGIDVSSIARKEDTAYIIYTSGTTGKPKGVPITHSNMLNYVSWFTSKNEISSIDKTVMLSSLSFDLGYTALYSSILTGAELHFIKKEEYIDSKFLLNYLEKNEITYLKMTPTLLSLITSHKDFESRDAIKSLRLMVLGGETLRYDDVLKCKKIFKSAKFINHYGPTESTVGVITKNLDLEKENINGIIGQPINNTQVYIVDKNLNRLPVGIYGEICISGAGLSKGYLNNESLTKERFITTSWSESDVLYRTGDIGRITYNGDVQLIGRSDRQSKVNGYRVELDEIDNKVLGYGMINECHSVMRKDSNDTLAVFTYIISEVKIDIENLKKYLYNRLPEYMVPRFVIQVDNIEVTANGKINLSKLPIVENQSSFEETSSEVDLTENEKKILNLWKKVLNRNSFNINDNFFEVGGYSIKAVELNYVINEEFNIEMPLSEIFIRNTIKKQAEYIESILENRNKFYVCYNKESAGKNIFTFPPIIGYGAFYREMAERVLENSIYAFDFIEDENKIDKYVEAITKIQPEGSYTLMGYSVGGSLALEVAEKLQKLGYNVENLIILDSTLHEDVIKDSSKGRKQLEEMAIEAGLEKSIAEVYIKKSIEYLEYFNAFTHEGQIDFNLQYLSSENNNNKYKKWKEKVVRQFNMYEGKGTHFELLNKDNIDYNIQILKKIIDR